MAPRRTRHRKTADKMAAYKAAASKVRQSSARSSPKTISQTRTRSSPRNSASKSPVTSKGEMSTSKLSSEPSSNASGVQKNSTKTVSNSLLSKSQDYDGRKTQNAIDDGSQGPVRSTIVFDPDEVIPETPPRDMSIRSRKRIIAPKEGEVMSEHGNGSGDEGRPTKKRRLFQTPPRIEERSFVDTPMGDRHVENPGTNVFEDLTPSGDDEASDIDSPSNELNAADNPLLDPPLRSTRDRPSVAGVGVSGRTTGYARRVTSLTAFPIERRDATLRQNAFGLQSTERSVGNQKSLEILKTSSATLSRLFDGFAAKVTNEIDDMRHMHMAEIRKVATTMNETVATEIRNLQVMMEMMIGGMKTVSPGRVGGNKSLRDWEKRLDTLTPYTTVVFRKELFSRILCFNAPLKAVDTYEKFGDRHLSDVERASLSAQTLLFRLQPADKKFQYSDDIGKLHSDFKFSVVQNAFYNVGIDSFGLFKDASVSRENYSHDNRSDNADLGKGRISRPSWLVSGNVTVDHINEARAFTETSGQSRKDKIRQTPSPDDIASHGALRVYRQLGKVLHDGRGNLRGAFFQGLGYLLVPWKGRVTDVDQRTMKLEFCEDDPFDDDRMNLTLSDIPDTSQCPRNADPNTIGEVDVNNKKLLQKLFSEQRGMILKVCHDVFVSKGSQQKTAQSDSHQKVLHRLINIVDVALDCCVEFCRVGSREVFLRTNKDSLRCVMIFALLFKAICVEFMSMSNPSASSAAFIFPEPTEVKVHGTCLKDIIPGLNSQKTVLTQKCLHLPSSVFDMLNHEGSAEEVLDEEFEDFPPVLDARKIEESAKDGVCRI